MKKIIVSKPFKDLEEITDISSRVKGKLERIQVDICDGKYVKNVSWPVTEYGLGGFESIGKKNDFDFAFPNWEDVDYQADLMIFNPEKYIDSLVQFGFDEVIVHFRALTNLEDQSKILFEKSAFYDLKIFFAVDIQTDFKNFENFISKNLDKISGIQVMGIENIGVQGQEFEPRSLDIVKNLKRKFPDLEIMFDGGIHEETLESIYESGVDVFCPGSMLTESEDMAGEIKYLKENLV